MDPDAAAAIVADTNADLTDRIDACANLVQWIDSGGFLPTEPIVGFPHDQVTRENVRAWFLIRGRHFMHRRYWDTVNA